MAQFLSETIVLMLPNPRYYSPDIVIRLIDLILLAPGLLIVRGHAMSWFAHNCIRFAIAALIGLLLVCGCSSSTPSDPNSAESASPGETETANEDDTNETADDDLTEGMPNELEDDITGEGTTDSPTEVSDPVVPDPAVQNSTRVNFEITVPAFVSNTLLLRIVWDNKDLVATWIGDEFWSASDDFPTNTENRLIVTFYDRNGDITLGSFEKAFKTGTNAAQSYQITADQFDTDRWDSDGDGVSNIDELIAGTEPFESPRVLLFTETRGFRHSSITNALRALEQLATSAGIQTDHAGDSAGVFTDVNLARYAAVVWVMTSGDVLNQGEQAAFENYIRSGGGYAGIHAASDTEYGWPWYGALVGAYFDRHPTVQSASQFVEDGSHPSTAHLSSTWTRTDEWYDYRSNPRAQVNVLLSLDEASYTGGGMGKDHPSAWYHEYDGGRSWYTGGGHTEASYSEPDFRAHLLGGLRYAAGHSASIE